MHTLSSHCSKPSPRRPRSPQQAFFLSRRVSTGATILLVALASADTASAAAANRTPPALLVSSELFLSNQVRGGSTTATTTATTTPHPARNLWWQSIFQRPSRRRAYRQALEEQIQWLEQQLRQVMDETQRLENQQQQQQQQQPLVVPMRNSRSNRKQLFAVKHALQHQLQALHDQFQDLAQAKQALEDLLDDQDRQLDHLAQACEHAHIQGQAMQADYHDQIDALTTRLHTQTQDQLATMDATFQERLQQAQQEARSQVWKDGKERLQRLAEELAHRYQSELHAERLHTHQAIERQRQKMRSLAKAMAVREKQLYQQQQHDLLKDQERQRIAAMKRQEQKDRLAEMEQARLQEEEQEARQQEEQRQAEKQELEEAKRLEEETKTELEDQAAAAAEQQQRSKDKTAGELSASPSSDGGLLKSAQQPFQKVLDQIRSKTKAKSKKSSTVSSPVSTTAKAANWQRRVPWQPGLPPTDTIFR